MLKKQIRGYLLQQRDEKYAEFQRKLIPSIKAETIIGVRTPILRKLAKALLKDENITDFLAELPHAYHEENQLHVFILSLMTDFNCLMNQLEVFLPYMDNWATCDALSPKIFKTRKSDLLPFVEKWLMSQQTYTIRFGIGMLLEHYLDEDFEIRYADMVSRIRSEEYYIKMMIAWYFATALAKQFNAALPYLEERRLDRWTHNKTIQKAVESYRVPNERKTYLKELRRAKSTGD